MYAICVNNLYVFGGQRDALKRLKIWNRAHNKMFLDFDKPRPTRLCVARCAKCIKIVPNLPLHKTNVYNTIR